MTAAEAVEFVRTRIELKNPPFPGTKLMAENVAGALRLTLRFEVPHRDTGEIGPIYQTEIISAFDDFPMPPDYFKHHVADFVRRAFMHEFGECFHVDGVRIFDPHQGEAERSTA